MSRNDLGIPQITRIVYDPNGADGDGVLKGRAVVYGPEANQVSVGDTGTAAGVALGSRKHGGDVPIQSEGFAEVESAGAVSVGAPVYVGADGRVGASGTARLGTATSASDGAGERLTVDLSSRGTEAQAAV